MSVSVVTGAFGYSGKRIAQRLLDAGEEVRTLTNKPAADDPFNGQVTAHPLDFSNDNALEEHLHGAEVLYCTYWVRFNHKRFTFAQAVENSGILFEAARRAGVKRIVHVSITNPSADSDLEYFSGKAAVEAKLKASGVSHAVLRPAVLFGGEDILINNIAWMLRRFPVFGLLGDGAYRLQPIHVRDFAVLAVKLGKGTEDTVVNAIGPETFTYRELVQTLGRILGKERPLWAMPPALGYAAARLMGLMLGDVVLTWQEAKGLMEGLLYVDAPPTGTTRLTEWAEAHADELGRHYASELGRRG